MAGKAFLLHIYCLEIEPSAGISSDRPGNTAILFTDFSPRHRLMESTESAALSNKSKIKLGLYNHRLGYAVPESLLLIGTPDQDSANQIGEQSVDDPEEIPYQSLVHVYRISILSDHLDLGYHLADGLSPRSF
jgi:hypothetical protein